MTDEKNTANLHEEFESLVQGLLEKGYGTLDGFIDTETVTGLRGNLMRFKKQGRMQPAGVGRKFDYQKNAMIRGDVIRWIEKDTGNRFERRLLDKIEAFIRYLNQTCYAGINDYEFHYALYEQNTVYKRHLDQFKSSRGRKYSLVMYLNREWKYENGGKLSLFLRDGTIDEVYPTAGRAVFFKSDEMEHEVGPAINRFRISIAGWLKTV